MAEEHEHEHGLVHPTPNTDAFDKEKRQQAVEADDKDNNEDNGQPQQEINVVAAEPTAERVGDTHLSDKEDGRPANRQGLLSSPDSCPEKQQQENAVEAITEDDYN